MIAIGFNTDLLHAGNQQEIKGSTLPPIYQSSAFYQESAEDLAGIFANKKMGYCYTRVANPTISAFEEKINSLNIMKGIEYNFYGKLDHTETFETYDWRGNETYGLRAFFKDANNGLVFTKDISWMGAIDKYKDEDGNYRFTGTIKFIAYKKQQIGFGGRLRATKPQKKSKK